MSLTPHAAPPLSGPSSCPPSIPRWLYPALARSCIPCRRQAQQRSVAGEIGVRNSPWRQVNDHGKDPWRVVNRCHGHRFDPSGEGTAEVHLREARIAAFEGAGSMQGRGQADRRLKQRGTTTIAHLSTTESPNKPAQGDGGARARESELTMASPSSGSPLAQASYRQRSCMIGCHSPSRYKKTHRLLCA
jgi:hypothetical protein